MGVIDEFKKFAVRGSMLDMAVGIAIGAAFNGAVNSLVYDILMPPIGAVMGNIDFSNFYINLSGGEYESLEAARMAGAATINYGLFINSLINLLVVAIALFIFVRWFNRTREEEQTKADSAIKECPYCRMSIPKEASRCAHCTAEV